MENNRLKIESITSNPTVFAQYQYAGGSRVSKMVRTGTDVSPIYERTIYIDGVFEYHKLENDSTYEKNYVHVMDDTSRICMLRIGDPFPDDIADAITYILEDQIGSSVARLNTDGSVIDKEEYYPFGDSSLRTFTKKSYRYVGKEKDAESGLYYYGARYYSAWTCRFISCDPKSSAAPNLTPYHYCSNNPINRIDPDGMQDEPSGGGEGQKATNITVNTQTDKDGNITGETRTETNAQLNEDGSYTIHSIKEQKTYDDKGELTGYSRSEYTESGDNAEFVSDTGRSIMNDAFGNNSAEPQAPNIATSPAEMEIPRAKGSDSPSRSQEAIPKLDPIAPKQIESKAPELAPAPEQQGGSQVDKWGVLRETANMWVDKTSKLLDFVGDVSSKVAKLFRGAGRVLGGIGIAFTLATLYKDIQTKPAWVAWTKGIIGVGLGVLGMLTLATPFGWAVLAGGFIYGMLEATGVVDSWLMWLDKNVVNPQPQYVPR